MRAGRGKAGAVLAAVVVATAAACGDGDGGSGDVEAARPPGFEATAAYLSGAIEESASRPYRFEAFVTMGEMRGGRVDGVEDVSLVTGASDGVRSSSTSDIGALVREMAESSGTDPRIDPDEVDLTIEIVTDGDLAYLHAPGYAELPDLEPGRDVPPLMHAAAGLGDRWGRVDLGALGEDQAELFAQLNQGQNVHPAFYIELVKDAREVEELGAEVFEGEALVGLSADVSLLDMVEAQGLDRSALVAQAPTAEAARVIEAFALPLEVWLDGRGELRRLVMDLGAGLRAAADEIGEGLGAVERLAYSTTIVFSDHDDESIVVELPDPAEVVDVTDEVA